MSTEKIIAIVVVVVVLAIVLPIVLAGFLVVYMQTLPQSGGTVETSLGLRAEKTSNGDWLISVASGSTSSTAVRFQAIDPNTGDTRYSYLLRYNSADADNINIAFHDNNANLKVDAGDSVLVRATGLTRAGDKVQLIKGDNIIGMIRELPS